LTLTTAVALQIAMLVAALGFTQLPWFHAARGRGATVTASGHFGYQRLTWLPGLMLDAWLALNLGRVRLSASLAWGCAAVGLLLFAAATALGFLGWLGLGPNRAPPVTVTEGQTLITTGVYRLLRHPAYAAVVLQYVGAGLALQNWVLLAGGLACSAFWHRAAHDEERLLVKHFGDAYRDYRLKTPQLVPFTHP
jgi:protein-S-isoprenylcysteine O-methyltransferase Ste14